jgi:lipid II:glycine glycyltransferase (peptidoglycan interpeptide bridge formation enzyme)
MNDIRQTREYAEYLSKIGWTIERIGSTYVFIRKFPIIGSVLKIQRPKRLDLEKIELLAKKYRAFQVIIEPEDGAQSSMCMTYRYKLSNGTYLPSKTLELDLTKSREILYKDLEKDCRYAIRKNDHLGYKIYELDNLEKFRIFWRLAVGMKRYVPPLSHLNILKKSFRENALFLTTETGSTGAIFLNARDVSYYWQAFANKEGRKKLCQYKILWEGILWAKSKGAKIFDFEGIFDERFPNRDWKGFTHFKKSFGGKEKEYPGCFVKNRLAF